MSTTIDNRVLEMRFDNKQFENGVATSMSTIDKLKQKLNLSGASKGLEDIGKSAKNVDMSGLERGVTSLQAKFSALQVVGVTALANITNSAVNAGKKIVSALTIDPIKTGFNEYETKMNSIQTIMSNTASKGTTMSDVTRVIDELNTYADKTIYNFAEMTRNIGTFTAAGVGLEESASAIQGIANLAAASGSSSQQASTAMYQLSQAIAAGTVKLMDWNSVVNAGMGGEKFQEALKATAREHGVAVDAIIEKNGSFRDSLQDGWLSADILNETLNKFTVDGARNYAKSMMESGKWTQEQADALIKEAQAMEDAATKVKTFTQLWDTLKEAAQSGWGKSWEIIVGDFEEAKELFTEISDVLGGLINKSSEARNKVLQEWKDLGGRTAIIDSFRNVFEGISSIVKPVSEAFREIFPPITAKQLVSFSEGLRDLTEKLKISGETAEKLKRTFKGVFSIFDLAGKGIGAIVKPIGKLFGSDGVGGIADMLLDASAAIGDFFTSLNESADTGEFLNGISEGVSNVVSTISDLISGATEGLSGFGDILSTIGDKVSDFAGKIINGIGKAFSWLSENISAGDIFAGLAGGGLFIALKKLAGLFGKVKDVIDKIFGGKDKIGGNFSEVAGKFSDVLDGVHDSLESFTSGIKATTLLSIAGAIGILSMSLKSIAGLKIGDISKSILAIGAMMTMLNLSFRSITKSLSKFDSKGIIKAGFTLMMMATAINIFANAMKKVSKLSWSDIGRGLTALGGGLLELTGALKIIGKTKVSLSTSVAILALAESCKILADALSKFSNLSWDEIARGLSAMGGALGELVASLAILSKVGGGGSILGSVGILIAVQALDEISQNLKRLGSMTWDEIGKGLSAMGGALGEFVIALGVLSKIGGFGAILGGTSILIAVQSLDEISQNLKRLGSMTWEEIGRGLSAMGGALGELTISLGTLSKIGGFGSILGGTSILIVVQALDEISQNLKRIGSMSWEEIGKGLSGMGGALGELSISVGALGKLSGFSGILGSGSILIAVQALEPIANALRNIGSLSWEEIGRGLSGMGGALLELGVVSGALGGLTSIGGILGSGSILIAVQGLEDLANALAKFGTMSWDEIGRGLTAMGGALLEVGVVSGALGSLTSIAGLVGSGSLLLAIQGLDELATSLKKFGEMNWDEIGRGLTAMGAALGETALGGLLNTFSGFGAGAIATIAEPLGALADSVKKWSGVTVPEGLGMQLGTLASGIRSFTFGGMGAGALSTAAEPLGTMADSVKKWSGVTVPEGLGDKLKQLASGVKSFSFAFMGGWSLTAIVGPLGELAGDVKKWNGVAIPEGLSGKLKGLASGVKSFSFAFVGGWSLNAIVGPLGSLAGAVKKWNGVSIPSNMGDNLKSLASGVKSFSGLSVGNLSSVCQGIKDIGSAVKTLSGIDFASISSKLTSFATSLNGINISSDTFSNLGQQIVNGFVDAINSGIGRVRAATSMLASSAVSSFAKSVSGASAASSSAGIALINGLVSGIRSGTGKASSSATAVVNAALNSIKSKSSAFTSAGKQLMNGMVNGLRSGSSSASSAVSSVVSSAVGSIRGYYGSFYSSGTYVASGFAAGIRANIGSAAAAAASMASAASAAASANLKINSPSKVFRNIGSSVPEGFVKGIGMFGKMINKSTANMTNTAIDGAQNAIDQIKNIMDIDTNVNPTIRPVLDLSNVKTGAGSINKLLKNGSTIGVSANINRVSSMMNLRSQNGGARDVVYAINKLRKDLGNVGNNTYNVNGITYDDGSNVASAVETLIRTAILERRS